jgi:hypothetical protein
MLGHVRQQLADRAEDDLADFLVEAGVRLVEGDFAPDIALRLELLAELEQAGEELSAGGTGHR